MHSKSRLRLLCKRVATSLFLLHLIAIDPQSVCAQQTTDTPATLAALKLVAQKAVSDNNPDEFLELAARFSKGQSQQGEVLISLMDQFGKANEEIMQKIFIDPDKVIELCEKIRLDTRIPDSFQDQIEVEKQILELYKNMQFKGRKQVEGLTRASVFQEESISKLIKAKGLYLSSRSILMQVASELYLLDGNPAKAMQFLEEARATGNEALAEVQYNDSAAVLAVWMCQNDEAVRLSRLVSLAPNCPQNLKLHSLITLAWASYHKGDTKQAVQCANDAMKLQPEPDDMVDLSSLLFDCGKLGEAKVLFEAGETAMKKKIQQFKQDGLSEQVAKKDRIAQFHLYVADYYRRLKNYGRALEEIAIAMPGFWGKLNIARAKLLRSYCLGQLGTLESEDDSNLLKVVADVPFLQREASLLFPNKALPQRPIRNRWGLIVGVSKFADESIPSLRFSGKDAEDVRKFLIERAGFPVSNVRILLDQQATRQNILDQLGDKWLPRVVGPDDLVLVFISSHGSPSSKDIAASNYLIAHDTTREHLFSQAIPMNLVSTLVAERVRPGYSFIVVDTCHSARTSGQSVSVLDSSDVNVKRMLASIRQLILCSSNTNQRSWESRRYANGIFTRQLLNALSYNPTYKDFHDVFNSVKKQVSEEVTADHHATQTPSLAGVWNGVGLFSPQSK